MILLSIHLTPKIYPLVIILSILGGLIGIAFSVYQRVFTEYGESAFAIGAVIGFFVGIII